MPSSRLVTPNKILLISLRYLGDVLLTTPVLRSLRLAYPNAQLHVLVYDTTAAMLVGNPDVDYVITTPLRIKLPEYVALIKRLFKQYDLAVVTQTGDRPFWYGLLAAKEQLAVVPSKGQTGWWKRFVVRYWLEFDNTNTHTVLQNLRLLDLIGVHKQYGLVPPQCLPNQTVSHLPLLSEPYVVLHPYPQWAYKRWPLASWVALGQYLQGLGFVIVLSGGNGQEELAYIADIFSQLEAKAVNLAGQLSLAQLTHVIANAKLYVGPDTGTTHLAAATGVKVIALYGPTNPIKWAPWPYDFSQDDNPFAKVGNQIVNNVCLLQGAGDCVPCHQEGCEKYRQSYSRCLDDLAIKEVKCVVDQWLAMY
jgi:heptosyltransferase III